MKSEKLRILDGSIEAVVIRSNRKSVGFEIKQEGFFIRAPFAITDSELVAFAEKHRTWITNHMERQNKVTDEMQQAGCLSFEEIKALADEACRVIPERVKFYAEKAGVKYGRITIRNQKTRWGSCSAKKNLNFNCLLMLTPPEVIDSVVAHEVCHLKEMNHSEKFYAEVLKIFPEYYKWHAWLKQHGPALMMRMP